ncbi:MAG TPA: DUF2752 domain-containing protein [Candidatus Acidoferrales bacterium]|nr:DUF2752 domain-containing protein [Candidatus Acidoferrales bacterium]
MRTIRTERASGPGPSSARLAGGWRAWALAGVVLAAAALVLHAWTPSDDPAQTLCLFRRLTGHDCATCGMTRALALLAKGDVRGSLARHPLALPLAAEVAALWLAWPFAIRARRLPPGLWRERWLLVHASAFLGVWAVRLLR